MPPSTQGTSASTSSSIPQAPSSSRWLSASNAAQQSSSQSVHQHASQQAQPPSVQANCTIAPNSVPNPAQPSSAQQALVQPTAVQPQATPTPADEIAALRAQIAKLKHGKAHSVPLLARAPAPQQALVADPAAVKYIRANLAGTKEESKCLTLPALQPRHKGIHYRFVDQGSILPCSVPAKVEDMFKQYHYIPYTTLIHAAWSKAFLCGEDSSYVFTHTV
ncbi:uncharacterized protein EDB93DRAFT_1103304 [Suillus bovinus]|uniref:uncharacterized protein n=1 Tax=Suillus bovinus TaxID=48563 RepID=UPI001B87E2C4|nr:uncharacterized protein EDB93DRAFT_1103304 [Suillus bovinus]KAG2151095.1 hypothetical protein EDB93DRAFT_1103304 [Suillus bovinus]